MINVEEKKSLQRSVIDTGHFRHLRRDENSLNPVSCDKDLSPQTLQADDTSAGNPA